jgi:hypothetical protein
MYRGLCAKIRQNTLLSETEDHRQPICIRLPSQQNNEVGSLSHILCQKSRETYNMIPMCHDK